MKKNIISKISNIDDYVNIEQEINAKIKNWDDIELESLKNMTFAIIGPDGSSIANLNRILKLIEKNKFKVYDFKVIAPMSEKLVEQLYKYSVPDAIKSRIEYKLSTCNYKSYCPYMKMIPTRNWRLLRKRFELGNSIVLLLKHIELVDAPIVFKQLKGSTDPLQCSINQIRYNTDNPVNSFVHSSDDTISVLRESFLFFSETEVLQTINSNDSYTFSYIRNSLSFLLPDPNEYRFIIIALKFRLRILYNYNIQKEGALLFQYYQDIYKIAIKLLAGKKMLALFTNLLNDEENFIQSLTSDRNISNEAISLLVILSDRNCFRNFDPITFKLSLINMKIPFNELELLVLESGLWYFRG